ncbi:MAG: hypothetical protein ACLTTW_07010 [Coprobacter sp.]
MDIKKVLAFLFFLCSLATGYSSVSDSLKISLITCSPGSQVYELFGHTGLRVQDVSRNVDVVFIMAYSVSIPRILSIVLLKERPIIV